MDVHGLRLRAPTPSQNACPPVGILLPNPVPDLEPFLGVGKHRVDRDGQAQVDFGAHLIGLEAQLALFPAHEVEECVGDLVAHDVLEHVGFHVALVHQYLAEFAVAPCPSSGSSSAPWPDAVACSEITPELARRLPTASPMSPDDAKNTSPSLKQTSPSPRSPSTCSMPDLRSGCEQAEHVDE